MRCPLYSDARDKILHSPNRLYFNMNTIFYGSELLNGADDDEF